MVGGLDVLVVDDSSTWIERLEPILKSQGFVVSTERDWESARETLLQKPFAVVIVDLDLTDVVRGLDTSGQEFEGFGLLSGLRFLREVRI